jgi:hypothetical protein
MSVDEDARDADFSTSALALSCSPSSSSPPPPPDPLPPTTSPPKKTNVNFQIYDLETRYLATANPAGTALKGYDGLLSSTGGAGGAGGGGGGAGGRRPATVKAEERLFSRSSTTGQPPGSK